MLYNFVSSLADCQSISFELPEVSERGGNGLCGRLATEILVYCINSICLYTYINLHGSDDEKIALHHLYKVNINVHLSVV